MLLSCEKLSLGDKNVRLSISSCEVAIVSSRLRSGNGKKIMFSVEETNDMTRTNLLQKLKDITRNGKHKRKK